MCRQSEPRLSVALSKAQPEGDYDVDLTMCPLPEGSWFHSAQIRLINRTNRKTDKQRFSSSFGLRKHTTACAEYYTPHMPFTIPKSSIISVNVIRLEWFSDFFSLQATWKCKPNWRTFNDTSSYLTTCPISNLQDSSKRRIFSC